MRLRLQPDGSSDLQHCKHAERLHVATVLHTPGMIAAPLSDAAGALHAGHARPALWQRPGSRAALVGHVPHGGDHRDDPRDGEQPEGVLRHRRQPRVGDGLLVGQLVSHGRQHHPVAHKQRPEVAQRLKVQVRVHACRQALLGDGAV